MTLEAPPWLIAWLDGVSLWDAVLWLALVVGAIVFIRKKGWRTVVALARGIIASAEILVSVQGLPDFIDRVDARLDEHTQQLKNSHTTNLRDELTEAVDLSREARDTAIEARDLAKGVHGRLDHVERHLGIDQKEKP